MRTRYPLGFAGFTLVELLVIVAVLATLAGLLLPVLAGAREAGRRTRCLANVHHLALANALYLQDWDERFPRWCVSVPRRPDPYGFCVYWTESLQPYLRNVAVFSDPSALEPGFDGVKLADYALLTCGPGGRGTREEPYFRLPGAPLFLTAVARPTQIVQLTDGWTTTGGTALDTWLPAGGKSGRNQRHAGGMNAGMVDGHARWLSEGEFWRVATNGRGFYWLHHGTADR